MSNENSLVIHLLDKEYRVACPSGEQDNLLAAARYLDKQLREVRDANVIGLERIAIMTALNMSHELLNARKAVSEDSESEARVQALLSRLEDEIQAFEDAPVGTERSEGNSRRLARRVSEANNTSRGANPSPSEGRGPTNPLSFLERPVDPRHP